MKWNFTKISPKINKIISTYNRKKIQKKFKILLIYLSNKWIKMNKYFPLTYLQYKVLTIELGAHTYYMYNCRWLVDKKIDRGAFGPSSLNLGKRMMGLGGKGRPKPFSIKVMKFHRNMSWISLTKDVNGLVEYTMSPHITWEKSFASILWFHDNTIQSSERFQQSSQM